MHRDLIPDAPVSANMAQLATEGDGAGDLSAAK
jgi:hypothetical protein